MGALLDLVQQHWQAESTGDVEAVLRFYAPGAEFAGPAIRVMSVEELRSVVSDSMRAFPNMQRTVLDSIESGDTLAMEIQASATNTGAIGMTTGQLPATGRTVQFQSCDYVKFQNGLITKWHTYYDRLDLFQQLGLAG